MPPLFSLVYADIGRSHCFTADFLVLSWLLQTFCFISSRNTHFSISSCVCVCGACVYMFMYVWVHTCMYMWMLVSVYVACVHMFMCVWVCAVGTCECCSLSLYVCVYDACAHMFVCVWGYACMYMCVLVSLYVCLSQGLTLNILSGHSPPYFLRQVLWGKLSLTDSTRQAGQQVWGILLSPPTQGWHYSLLGHT